MAIFAISDLHLPLSCNKPMDIFGSQWSNYTERMCKSWNKIVAEHDTVIVPGDISWATYIDDAEADFKYIHLLNGKKLLLKGNHDYWWTTQSKMDKFLSDHGFDSIKILQNTAYLEGETAICGTRGWTIPAQGSSADDKKIYEREKLRLILSLESAKSFHAKDIIVAMHYPPIDKDMARSDFLDIMREYRVTRCVYGHLHAASHKRAPVGEYCGIRLNLVSCDFLSFTPYLIR